MLGGWEGFDRINKGPLALQAVLRPGTTWFMQAEEAAAAQVLGMHGAHIGGRPSWGFGQIVIGTWKE